MTKKEAPVLLITFNRPDTTKKVFQKIREARPAKLYVATDGPRAIVPSDTELVNEVKQIVQRVDWPCKTHYRFNKKNTGAEITVSSAISWVLRKEESVIILEDDILAPISFFRFAQEMLEIYADREEIASVSGSNFTPLSDNSNADYFFSKYGHTWGWATWKRAWEGYDLNMPISKNHYSKSFLRTVCNTPDEVKFYKKKYRRLREKGIGNITWDKIEQYRRRVNNKLSVVPRVNLTSNIGVYGLHANGRNEHHFRPYDETFKVRNHPKSVRCNLEYDIHHFETYINKKKPIWKRGLKKILRILNLR